MQAHGTFLLSLIALLLPLAAVMPQETKPIPANEPQKADVKIIQLHAMLQEPIEMMEFQAPGIKVKECLMLLSKKFAAKGKRLHIFIDVAALKDRAEALPDPYEAELDFTKVPLERMPAGTLLRLALSQIPTSPPNNAALLLRNGQAEITTKKAASLPVLLQQRVIARYEKRPLTEVLEDLSERTGVSINLDPRATEKNEAQITAAFRNDATLGAAIRIVSDMAGLQMVDMKSAIYVTTPANAEKLERALTPKKSPEREPKFPPVGSAPPSPRSPPPPPLPTIEQELLENRSARDCPYPGTGVNPLFRVPPKK